MTYLKNLWHDLRQTVAHFVYIRKHLRAGGNPDQASF